MFTVAASVAAGCAPASGPQGPGPWTWTELRVEGPQRSQGLATDPSRPAPSDTWYTSQFTLERAASDGTELNLIGSLPADVLLTWKNSHTGDPDADGGRVVVPWENKQLGPSDPPTKSFGVYDARSLELQGWAKHILGPGETNDNPWVAITPDGKWMVTGRYTPLAQLEVYPVPTAPYADLPLVATIPLDTPPSAVQGCDFASDRQLVCASNDEGTGKQVFTLALDAPLGSAGTGATTARISYEGAAPQAYPLLGSGSTSCADVGEVEGIDAQHVAGRGTVVRLLVVDRCYIVIHEYEHVIADN